MSMPHSSSSTASSSTKRKEIYKYQAPWPLYSMNWSVRPDKRFRLALGSFVEEYNNKVQIISLDEDTSEFSAKSTFDHPYPTTKIMWIPDSKGVYPDLLATSVVRHQRGLLAGWICSCKQTTVDSVALPHKNTHFLQFYLPIFFTILSALGGHSVYVKDLQFSDHHDQHHSAYHCPLLDVDLSKVSS